MKRIHELKTHPGPFQALWDGTKTFEVRLNDRAFAVGDELYLREYCPAGIGTEEVGREPCRVARLGQRRLPARAPTGETFRGQKVGAQRPLVRARMGSNRRPHVPCGDRTGLLVARGRGNANRDGRRWGV